MKSLRWAILGLCLAAAPARADGRLVLNGRELLREGPESRGYCSAAGRSPAAGMGGGAECDRVLTKVLSGYTYGRGYAQGGAMNDASGVPHVLGALHMDLAAGSLPGGELALGAFDAVGGQRAPTRLRFTLFSGESLFVCRDAQTGELGAPISAMFSRNCRPSSWFGVDVGALAMQWQISDGRLLAEWLRLGPAFELLGNGFGYAHLSRSIGLALPFDVRSASRGSETRSNTGNSLGLGLRLSTFYRSPQWELRLSVRHRAALAGGTGVLRDNSLESELRFVHNFFVSDAIVMQAGISLRALLSQRSAAAFMFWPSDAQRAAAFAGVHLGWVHEAPDI